MFKVNLTRKKLSFFSIFMVLFCLIAGILAYSFNIYPGGYSIKENSEEVTVIKKNFSEKDKHTFEISEENELIIFLIKNDVKQLLTMWLVIIFSVSSLLINLVNLLHRKEKIVFYITSIILIILLPLVINVYIGKLDHIEQLLEI
ncbi:hypothetical protein MKZ08_08195 [Viridibacillus sp. FSL R5-0477]|uniref:Uncharacterized protein n=1 Tax=Viridibacillus arenosi FSL R5-213 TaxID=1227360 RepID=W4EVE4_9BACL|nr:MULTISPECIES: hypothetical protein [Viridibacillus]ETT84224.1 hypothetical protein C176_12688 [Viridibacillus arenosi FSL R5-213]OMC79255.1 hypothetical protein BK130_18890 [Viridibacillus sp. FSL H8-0123]OMC86476.1 hypothetical protein BK128_10425 [Viridibacillus sp. FSL H7-0596]OMC89982.1 hypothetical protein BK137_14635 [Viridibacillus arenosi]